MPGGIYGGGERAFVGGGGLEGVDKVGVGEADGAEGGGEGGCWGWGWGYFRGRGAEGTGVLHGGLNLS